MIIQSLQVISFAVPFVAVLWLWKGVRHWAIGLIAIAVGVLVALLATGMFYGLMHFTTWAGGDFLFTSKLMAAAGLTSAGLIVLALNLVAHLKSRMAPLSRGGS